MEMKYATVSGKNNGQTYSLNAGTRTVTGQIWATNWNNNLTNTVSVGSVLYKSNPVLADSRIASTTSTVNKNGVKRNMEIKATGQAKGTYYLYFHKPNNQTTVKGSGTIK
ncbi:hypothetical protein ACE1TH_13170 [Shouchella sp. JSM 1781072]